MTRSVYSFLDGAGRAVCVLLHRVAPQRLRRRGFTPFTF
jgi:hypothetical protein